MVDLEAVVLERVDGGRAEQRVASLVDDVADPLQDEVLSAADSLGRALAYAAPTCPQRQVKC
jgi:hypothetical protein